MTDILERLVDLHKQATTERSHYYVARCCLDAINEIKRLRYQVDLCLRVAKAFDEGKFPNREGHMAKKAKAVKKAAKPVKKPSKATKRKAA